MENRIPKRSIKPKALRRTIWKKPTTRSGIGARLVKIIKSDYELPRADSRKQRIPSRFVIQNRLSLRHIN